MTRRILAGIAVVGIAVAGIFLGIVPTVTAAPPEGKFTLVDPRPRLIAGQTVGQELEREFVLGRLELVGVPDGDTISLTGEMEDVASEDDRMVTSRPGSSGSTGTASLSVIASVDPTTGAVTGTWSATLDSSRWGESEMASKKDPSRITRFLDHTVATNTWVGEVTGTVGETRAEISYSGQRTTTRCVSTTQMLDTSGQDAGPPLGPDDCVFPPMLEKWWTVDYTVAGAPAATAGGGGDAEPRGIVSGVTGAVSYSPADQADLEPGARTWIQVKPGDKILMQDGVTLRTGRDGGVKVLYVTGALVRLHPSTMLTMKPPTVTTAKPITAWSLLSGIVDLFVRKPQGVEIKPGYWVETDTAITSIKGTTLRVAIVDGATVVTTTEGVVSVTARATNQTVDVGAGQAATVDAKGVTIAPADPADLLDPADPDAADLGADPAAGAAPAAAVAPSPAVPATTGPTGAADATPADGGSGLPIVPIVGAALVVVVIGAVAVFAIRRGKPGPGGA